MRSPAALYPLLDAWLQALDPGWHASARRAVAQALAALLVAQSLHPADLVRALDCRPAVPARQRFKRLARSWERAWLAPDWLIPRLVRAALALVPPDPAPWPTAGLTHLVLDSVRCGRWEVVTVGVRWHGRVLLIGWAVLPQPWPKGTFTPAVCALLRRVAATWPAARPVPLVADRGFPSRALLGTLAGLGWGFTVRLRADAPLVVDDAPTTARTLLAGARPGQWTNTPATDGGTQGQGQGQVVVGRGLLVVPWHQRDQASQRQRARQRAEQRRHRTQRWPGRAETDAWVVLCTTLPAAVARRVAPWVYRERWATEGTYRELQGGWDGRHGWDLEGVLARVGEQAQVERLVGLAALGLLVQQWLGVPARHAADAPAAPGDPVAGTVAGTVASWTTSGRLSVWARGQLALTDARAWLAGWVEEQLAVGAARLAAAPPWPRAAPRPLPVAIRPPLPQAA